MFARAGRLSASRDFARIYRKGQAARSRLFRFAWMPAVRTRIAVVTGRKVSTKAVVRNRLKRQVRGSLRTLLSQLTPVDLIVQLQPAIVDAVNYQAIHAELTDLLRKAALLR